MRAKREPFHFKHFHLFQDRTAMKIGTDGVLLGAWVQPKNAKQILDIGTGTALISLMLAQKSEAEINSIEIDLEAVYQAKENILNSPWSKQISLWNIALQTYAHICETRFDLIVSNPPFFNSEKTNTSREIARQQGKLKFEELVRDATTLLSETGRLCVVIPTDSEERFTTLASEQGLYKNKICKVFGNPSSPSKRCLLEYGKIQETLVEESLTIEKDKRHEYTSEYIALVKDYMLFA